MELTKLPFSTIVENMFQYFDEDLIAENGRCSELQRGLKLRAALLVFFLLRSRPTLRC